MADPGTAPTTINPRSQVPLDSIPISPDKENRNPNMSSEDVAQAGSGAAETGDEQITVFHDKDNFNVKHPLMCEWTLWFTKPPSGKVQWLSDIAPTNVLIWHRAIIGTNF